MSIATLDIGLTGGQSVHSHPERVRLEVAGMTVSGFVLGPSAKQDTTDTWDEIVRVPHTQGYLTRGDPYLSPVGLREELYDPTTLVDLGGGLSHLMDRTADALPSNVTALQSISKIMLGATGTVLLLIVLRLLPLTLFGGLLGFCMSLALWLTAEYQAWRYKTYGGP